MKKDISGITQLINQLSDLLKERNDLERHHAQAVLIACSLIVPTYHPVNGSAVELVIKHNCLRIGVDPKDHQIKPMVLKLAHCGTDIEWLPFCKETVQYLPQDIRLLFRCS